ncbi:hypothetical protein, partial [Gordonia sp. NPDC003585]|uniref:hypothetical protein n=1 Tax=Gordonia sp. NPDC003585 TaxID=3154275 RepID=UPI0033A9714D
TTLSNSTTLTCAPSIRRRHSQPELSGNAGMDQGLAVAVAVLVALIVAVNASSGGDARETSKTTTTTTSYQEVPLSGLQTYETPDQLYADFSRRYICTDYFRDRGGWNSASSGECNFLLGDNTTRQLIFLLFSSETNKQSQIALYRSLGPRTGGYGFVEGGNWLVNCGDEYVCEYVAGVLGGRTEARSY